MKLKDHCTPKAELRHLRIIPLVLICDNLKWIKGNILLIWVCEPPFLCYEFWIRLYTLQLFAFSWAQCPLPLQYLAQQFTFRQNIGGIKIEASKGKVVQCTWKFDCSLSVHSLNSLTFSTFGKFGEWKWYGTVKTDLCSEAEMGWEGRRSCTQGLSH